LQLDGILREAEVKTLTGLSRTTRWRLIKKLAFPPPVSITDRAIGWKASEIETWLSARAPRGGTLLPDPSACRSRSSTETSSELADNRGGQ
jgi:prophage regulatory protein